MLSRGVMSSLHIGTPTASWNSDPVSGIEITGGERKDCHSKPSITFGSRRVSSRHDPTSPCPRPATGLSAMAMAKPMPSMTNRTRAQDASTLYHENLREALVEATRQLIEEEGPLGFTMAEAARCGQRQPGRSLQAFQGSEGPTRSRSRCGGFEMFAGRLEAAPVTAKKGTADGVFGCRNGLSRLRAPVPRLLYGDVESGVVDCGATPT